MTGALAGACGAALGVVAAFVLACISASSACSSSTILTACSSVKLPSGVIVSGLTARLALTVLGADAAVESSPVARDVTSDSDTPDCTLCRPLAGVSSLERTFGSLVLLGALHAPALVRPQLEPSLASV